MKIIECPRDAMQGIKPFIPTSTKAKYINQLLKVGFDTVDFGSFVSPKAVPQMKDTADVLEQLDLSDTQSKLLAIVANKRGAKDACAFDAITYLGYPFSISETFQQKNTNATIEQSLERVEQIQQLCTQYNKSLVIYISMAFGNPYDDPWNAEVALRWTKRLASMGVKTIAMADTVGVANPDTIRYLFENLIPELPGIEIGAHFHTRPDNWEEKVKAAYESGCKRFDSALQGYGGCPMAKDELVGNMATEKLIQFFEKKQVEHGLNKDALQKAMQLAPEVFQ